MCVVDAYCLEIVLRFDCLDILGMCYCYTLMSFLPLMTLRRSAYVLLLILHTLLALACNRARLELTLEIYQASCLHVVSVCLLRAR